MKKKRKKRGVKKTILLGAGAAALLGSGLSLALFGYIGKDYAPPEEVLKKYMDCIEDGDYKGMYQMIDVSASGGISQEDFVQRNSNIYEGIEVQNLQIELQEAQEEENAVSYTSRFDTVAGKMSFSNTASFTKTGEGYKLIWSDALIFPELEEKDKVRVYSTRAKRGRILDRNGRVMAGQGTATSVGLVPMYMEADTIKELALLLDMEEESIEEKMSASWIRDDSFVPVKTISKIEDLDLIAANVEEEVVEEYQRQKEILGIPGVMFQDVEVREYPYREAAAHLII